MIERPRERQQLGCVRFRQVDGRGDAHDRHHKKTYRETGCGEDIAQGQRLAHQASLHRWRSGLSPEFQSSVRPDEVVMTSQELNVPAELVFKDRKFQAAPAWPRRKVALDDLLSVG